MKTYYITEYVTTVAPTREYRVTAESYDQAVEIIHSGEATEFIESSIDTHGEREYILESTEEVEE